MADESVEADVAVEVLERAAEIDAGNAESVTLDQLRSAAHEAGISPQAFEQAVAELRALNKKSKVSLESGRVTATTFLMAAIGTTVGVPLAGLLGFGSMDVLFGAVIATTSVVLGLPLYRKLFGRSSDDVEDTQ